MLKKKRHLRFPPESFDRVKGLLLFPGVITPTNHKTGFAQADPVWEMIIREGKVKDYEKLREEFLDFLAKSHELLDEKVFPRYLRSRFNTVC
jgi:hypothetical protein